MIHNSSHYQCNVKSAYTIDIFWANTSELIYYLERKTFKSWEDRRLFSSHWHSVFPGLGCSQILLREFKISLSGIAPNLIPGICSSVCCDFLNDICRMTDGPLILLLYVCFIACLNRWQIFICGIDLCLVGLLPIAAEWICETLDWLIDRMEQMDGYAIDKSTQAG